MTFLRSAIFNLLFIAWALLSSIIFAPLFLVSQKMALKAGRPWAKGALLLARLVLGIRHQIKGAEHITNGPVIYASKHQSAWDTCIFLVLLDAPCYVLKKELLKLPGWGWYLWRMGMIAIDRSGGASTIKQMIKDGKQRLAEGRTIVIYPEGTRTRPGSVPEYHPGVVALYNQLNVPVVPVALNSGLFWGKNAFLKKPGLITIEFLPPMPPGMKKDEFKTQLEAAIENASNQLIKNAGE